MSGQTYCFAHHLRQGDGARSAAPEGGVADRVVAIRYDDRYARHHSDAEPRWRFERRDVRMLWRARHDIEMLGWGA